MNLTLSESEDRFDALFGAGRGDGTLRSEDAPNPEDALSPVERVLADILKEARHAFHPRHLANKANISLTEAKAVLERWVDDGRLTRQYEVLCPELGRTLTVPVIDHNDIPIGEELDCPYCDDPHLITYDDVWVTYFATPRPNSQ